VLILDSERLALLTPHLHALHLPVLLVRPTSKKHAASPHVKEFYKALSTYSGSTKAWEKEPEAQPDDNATVRYKIKY